MPYAPLTASETTPAVDLHTSPTHHEQRHINSNLNSEVLREIVRIFLRFGPDAGGQTDRMVIARAVHKQTKKSYVVGHGTVRAFKFTISESAYVCLGNGHLLVQVPLPAALVHDKSLFGDDPERFSDLGNYYVSYHMVNPAPEAWGKYMRVLMVAAVQMEKDGSPA